MNEEQKQRMTHELGQWNAAMKSSCSVSDLLAISTRMAALLQGLDADGNVTLTDGEETYAFPVKSAGYVKLCDDEDLFG